MMEKSSGNEVGGGLSLGLWRCMYIISKQAEGTYLTNLDKNRGRGILNTLLKCYASMVKIHP